MKNIIITAIFISWFSIHCKAQESVPFYEQLAFDFYNSEILPNSDLSVRLKISDEMQFMNYIDAACLKEKIINEKNISTVENSNSFENYGLNLENINKKYLKKVWKIKNDSRKADYVVVSTAQVYTRRIFVVIRQMAEGRGKVYTFEFNTSGEIIDWCQSSQYLQLIIE